MVRSAKIAQALYLYLCPAKPSWNAWENLGTLGVRDNRDCKGNRSDTPPAVLSRRSRTGRPKMGPTLLLGGGEGRPQCWTEVWPAHRPSL